MITELYVPRTRLADFMKAAAAELGRRGVPVIYANDNRGRWRSDFRQVVEWSLQGPGADITRALMPDDSDLAAIEPFKAPLVTVSAFDLGQGRLTTFSAYRFLYERLIGAEVRPWLPSAFCSAAALPNTSVMASTGHAARQAP